MAGDNVLGIQATINGKDIQQGANEFIRQLNRMEIASDNFTTTLAGKASLVNGEIKEIGNTFDSVVGSVVKGVAAMGVAFSAQQFASQVMKVRGEFQQLEVAFNTMLGSAEKANELMAQLTRTAAITPFGLQDVAGGAKQLLAYGVASEQVNDTLIRLGDIAAGLSIPLNDLVYLYGTTMTQGRMFTQDLRQFQGRGIPLADELAKQFGVTKDKVGELVTAGKVGFEEMNKAIISMTSEGGKFGGLMEAQSKTITGQISNIEDAIDSMFNEIGQSTEGIINTSLGVVSSLVENYEKVGEAIGVAVTAYGAYKAAVMVGIAWQKAEAAVTAEAALQKALAAMAGHTLTASQAKGAAVAQLYAASQAKVVASLKALASATILNPYVLIAGAIAATTYGIYKLANAETEEERATRLLNKALDEQNKKYESHRKEVDELISTLGNLELSEGTRIANFQQLKREYPEILKNINTENEFLREKYNILQQINQQQAKNKQQDDIKLLEEAERKLENIKKAQRDSTESTITNSYLSSYGGGSGINYDKELNAQLDVVNKLKARVAQPELGKYLEDISKLGDTDITEALEETTHILQALENAGDNAIGYVTELNMELSKSQIQTLKSSLESEKDARDGTKKSASEWLKQYKKEYDDASKAVKDYMAKKTTLSEVEFERGLKELTDKRDAAKKKYEDAGGSSKVDNKEQENAEKRANELLSIQRKNEQDRINLMEEGTKKRLAQIELDYQKEIDAIEEQKNKWKEAQGGTLTDEQHATIGMSIVTAEDKKNKSIDKVVKEEAEKRKKAEKEAQQELLIQFGNYQEQRQGIEQKYADLKAKAVSDAEKKLLDKQMEAELESVDEKFGYTTTAMADLFEDASNKSVNSIQKIIDKYEMLVAFKSGTKQDDGTNVTKEELIEVGISEKDLESLETGKISIKDITDALKALKGELKEQSPWQSFTNDLKDAISKLKTAKGDSTKIGEGLMGIGNAVTSFTPALKDFGANIGNIFGFEDSKLQSAIDGVAGLGQTAAGVGQIMSGDIVGGAMSAVSGISSVVTAFDGLFGADYSQYNKLVEEYNGLIDVWDKIIDRKREYINIDYGDEARKAGEESLAIINKEIEAWRTLGEERLNAGASAGSHSIGVRQRKNMSQEGWNELKAAAREIGFNYSSVADGRMTGLFDLTAEQLEELQEKAPTFWAKLDEDVREYLEKIIESNTQLEETKRLLEEATTGVSFDSFYDSFVSTLSDMNSSSKDFAEDFGEYLKNAILSNLIANKYKAKIQELYDQWVSNSDTNEDGVYDLTPEESAKLKEAQEALAEQMIAERDAMAKTFGWEDTYSQEATSKGFQAMSQDTGEELNGRFTALQVAGEEIRKQSEQQTVLQTLISTDTAAIRQQIAVQTQYISEIVDIQYESVGYLSEISKNTKQLFQMNERLGKIEENTRNI